jgi:hypothetical protein
MKVLLLILAMITLVFGETSKEETILQKLIIPSSTTEVSLEAIQKYCDEDETMHSLQEKYDFHIKIQRLGDYNVTVITPLKSIALRNTLFIMLSPLYKDIFYIKVTDRENTYPLVEEDSVGWIYYGIGLQWIVLCILSLVGLILSIQSRIKIGQLMKSQDKLQKEQKKMEEEIKSLGGDSEKSI